MSGIASIGGIGSVGGMGSTTYELRAPPVQHDVKRTKPPPSKIVQTQIDVLSKNSFKPILNPSHTAHVVGLIINAHV